MKRKYVGRRDYRLYLRLPNWLITVNVGILIGMFRAELNTGLVPRSDAGQGYSYEALFSFV